jgi:hypothetical protein
MEASKVTLNSRMIEHLNNPIMNRKKKYKLRENAIIEYINSKPNGSLISMSELISTAHMSVQGGYTFINRMLKEKKIFREPARKRGMYTWSTKKDIKIINPPAIKLTDTEIDLPYDDPKEDIFEKAKDFAWRHNSDSLRSFINELLTEKKR